MAKEKKSWVQRLKRSIKELAGGKNTYMPKKRPGDKHPLVKYAEETGKSSYEGASGSDLEELQKRFGKKKVRRMKGHGQ